MLTLDELNDAMADLSDRSGAHLDEDALDDLVHAVAAALGMGPEA